MREKIRSRYLRLRSTGPNPPIDSKFLEKWRCQGKKLLKLVVTMATNAIWGKIWCYQSRKLQVRGVLIPFIHYLSSHFPCRVWKDFLKSDDFGEGVTPTGVDRTTSKKMNTRKQRNGQPQGNGFAKETTVFANEGSFLFRQSKFTLEGVLPNSTSNQSLVMPSAPEESCGAFSSPCNIS